MDASSGGWEHFFPGMDMEAPGGGAQIHAIIGSRIVSLPGEPGKSFWSTYFAKIGFCAILICVIVPSSQPASGVF